MEAKHNQEPLEKNEILHVEGHALEGEDLQVTLDGNGLLKSRFDQLSIPRTLWVFRRAVLVTLAVYTGYMCEGFEVGR
jgi:hypothetical protein